MEDQRTAYSHRIRLHIKLYTLVLLLTVAGLGVLFQRELAAKFQNKVEYIDISFSVYGGLVGSMLNLLVYLPLTFRQLRNWSEEDREANFCWLFLRPLLGGLSGFVSYGFINALPIQFDAMQGQRIFWFMFCIAVFAGFKSEDFILRFSQRFESLIPGSDQAAKSDASAPAPTSTPVPNERVLPFRRRPRTYRNL